MKISAAYATQAAPIAELFKATFSASEGIEEGALVGDLARRLMAETPTQDLRVFTAWSSDAPVGAIIFSRLVYEGTNQSVFVLGPVAVATDHQRQGVGQQLISHGIAQLRREGVARVVTYGDPAFYRRVGFTAISENDMPAPFPLQHPAGWLGQSLTAAPLTPLRGPARCVQAFNDPVFW